MHRSENLQWWDERARLHGDDTVYDTSAFLAGQSTLYGIDHETTGGVTDQDLIYLQCHTGMDTLSWLRAGARRVVGVDFSSVAIDKATALAQSAGLADRAQFHVADVLDLRRHLRGSFDVCYASRGVLCWIGDLDEWMRQAAGVLRPGGRLVRAAIASGFTINHVGEHLAVETDGPRGFATREDDGLMRWRYTNQPLPIMFSLRALTA